MSYFAGSAGWWESHFNYFQERNILEPRVNVGFVFTTACICHICHQVLLLIDPSPNQIPIRRQSEVQKLSQIIDIVGTAKKKSRIVKRKMYKKWSEVWEVTSRLRNMRG